MCCWVWPLIIFIFDCGHYRIIQTQVGGRTLLVLDVLWTLISSSLFAVTTWEDVMAQGMHSYGTYTILNCFNQTFDFIVFLLNLHEREIKLLPPNYP